MRQLHLVDLVQSKGVARRRGVEGVDAAAVGLLAAENLIHSPKNPTYSSYLCIDVLDQLVHVFVIDPGVCVLEVAAHRQHDVVRAVAFGLHNIT